MSGQWPPGWDDPDDVPGAADQYDAEAEARLSEVAAYLASVPALLMPGSVEARISAALAVEAASRAGLTSQADRAVRTDGTAQADSAAQAQEAAQAAATAGPRVIRSVPVTRAQARTQAR